MNNAVIYCEFAAFGHLFQGLLFSTDLEEGQHYYLTAEGFFRKLRDLKESVIDENTGRHEFKERFEALKKGSFGSIDECHLTATIDMYPFNNLRLTEGSPRVNCVFQQGKLIGFALI